MQLELQVGPIVGSDGQPIKSRAGKMGDQIASNLHGKYFEQAARGGVFSGGMGLTAINNTTFTTNTLGATCTPIFGIYNPPTSGVSAVLLRAMLGIAITAATNTGGGPFVWASSVGNVAVSTGNAPLNRKTGAAIGSACKDMSGVALTGLTNNLVVRNASILGGGSSFNFSFVGTAAGPTQVSSGQCEELSDGTWIVPPGGVLALLATTVPVAHSAVSGGEWEEIAAALMPA